MTVLQLTDENEVYDAIDSVDGRVVVLFTAPAWCGPCRKFEPQYVLAANMTNAAKFIAVDIDKAPWTTDVADIRAVPTIRLYEGGKYIRDLKPAAAKQFVESVES